MLGTKSGFMVVSLTKGTPLETPIYYNPYILLGLPLILGNPLMTALKEVACYRAMGLRLAFRHSWLLLVLGLGGQQELCIRKRDITGPTFTALLV